jgi:hypothetical protein
MSGLLEVTTIKPSSSLVRIDGGIGTTSCNLFAQVPFGTKQASSSAESHLLSPSAGLRRRWERAEDVGDHPTMRTPRLYRSILHPTRSSTSR